MDELNALKSLGFTMPDPWAIAAALAFSGIGYVAYRAGKSAKTPTLKWVGVVLMLYSYVVTDLVWMLATGIVLSTWAYTLWKQDQQEDI